MARSNLILGIDIGSICVHIALIDRLGSVVHTDFKLHKGAIKPCLEALLERISWDQVGYVAVTSDSPAWIKGKHRYDARICAMTAAGRLHDTVGSILLVGGENFGLITFDDENQYRNYQTNASCAAGTGSFLDQQAERLSLKDIGEFCSLAREAGAGDQSPRIASRCAVFAKTDLIHAQQEGYTLAQICDGLSFGLARNIVDALYFREKPRLPLIFAGGVALNDSVTGHLERLLKAPLTRDGHAACYGALGAAFLLEADLAKGLIADIGLGGVGVKLADILANEQTERNNFYAPLDLKLSSSPDFNGLARYEFLSTSWPGAPAVEVDQYEPHRFLQLSPLFIGIDIGSTSTKAILLDDEKRVLMGFYTRTAGRPLLAVQVILEAIASEQREHAPGMRIIGAGTTGSGRKFIGKLIGADLALDEITAHARAACELDPEVDTIIEIGGQDAKFTTLRNGIVTFSIMNNVCAAGTGSFIEEQAKKLGCPLSDYAERVGNAPAPLASDRCTVFMERDLNHYLNKGHEVNEVLAAVLHSVRENYLRKVAIEKNIGQKIFFQGATAKNRALVAAFEQRLQRPIMVSRYCHLTGALGVALTLHDERPALSTFRGLMLYQQEIAIRNEVCESCTNHCKLKVAEVEGHTVAYGFLCGKEYHDKKMVKVNPAGFDLFAERRRIYREEIPVNPNKKGAVVGIPAALYLCEDLPMWRFFFHRLGIKTVTSEHHTMALKEGMQLAGAAFCAPIAALYGHVAYLAPKVDYLFVPDYMETKSAIKGARRQYCYFTQFASTIASTVHSTGSSARILSPLVRTRQSLFNSKINLFRMIKDMGLSEHNFLSVASAFDAAIEYQERADLKLKELFLAHYANGREIKVVLLGRPYTVLPTSMNKGIPAIFSRLGVKVFFQDMVEAIGEGRPQGCREILEEIHWNYGGTIIEVAEAIAGMRGVYPVLVSAFKCTPDAYIMEYFKQILDEHKKPYLILQLDEHDSNVGYETRIEAAVRAFRNHNAATPVEKQAVVSAVPSVGIVRGSSHLQGKTLLLPSWDLMVSKLMEAVLRREGIDVRILDESEESIQRSLRLNTGQCLPLSAVAQNVIDYVERYHLDPASTMVWTLDSKISCGLGIFSHYLAKLLRNYGRGMEKIQVFKGELTFVDFSLRTAAAMYFAYMFAGIIKKIGCQLRPYEEVKGSTDKVIQESLSMLYGMFLCQRLPEEALLAKIASMFEGIQIKQEPPRPLVAIFGDLYARDNDIMNQNLIQTIERHGGEVVTTPYNEYLKIIGESYIRRWLREGMLRDAVTAKVMSKVIPALEQKYYAMFAKFMRDPLNEYAFDHDAILQRFHMKPHHTGELPDNMLKVFALVQRYPDLSLLVQAGPAYCCPSLMTEAVAGEIEREIGIPIVTIEYDGIGGNKNDRVIPYLKFPRKNSRHLSRGASGEKSAEM